MGWTFIIIMAIILSVGAAWGIIYYLDYSDKRYVRYGEREFYCYCEGAFSGRMCCVGIYEYFPKKKIFKTKYRCYKTFWIEEYDTIREGLYKMIETYINEEKEEKHYIEKWKNFSKNS